MCQPSLVGMWLWQNYDRSYETNARVRATELYGDYMTDTQDKDMDQKKFKQAMEFNTVRKIGVHGARYYKGIELKEEEQRQDTYKGMAIFTVFSLSPPQVPSPHLGSPTQLRTLLPGVNIRL